MKRSRRYDANHDSYFVESFLVNETQTSHHECVVQRTMARGRVMVKWTHHQSGGTKETHKNSVQEIHEDLQHRVAVAVCGCRRVQRRQQSLFALVRSQHGVITG